MLNDVLTIGNVIIDGDKFVLALPVIDQIESLLFLVNNCEESQKAWEDFWGENRNFLYTLRRQGKPAETWQMYSISLFTTEIFESFDVLQGNIVSDVDILPILIPIDSNGKYDKSALKGFANGELSIGGTLYIDGQPVKAEDRKVPERTITIGDTWPGYELKWFKLWGVLFGAFTLPIDWNSFSQFVKKFVSTWNV